MTGSYSYGQIVYVPTPLRSTFFENKGDAETAITPLMRKTWKNDISGAHGAVAFSNHFAFSTTVYWNLKGAHSQVSQKWDQFGLPIWYIKRTTTQKDLDASIGYFQSSPKGSKKRVYEIYAGFGHSHQIVNSRKEYFQSRSTVLTTNTFSYDRYYIQQAWGRNGEVADLGFVLRSTLLVYKDSKSDILLEPCYTTRIGYKSIKFMFQISCVLHTNNSTYSYRKLPLYGGFDIYYMLNNHSWNFGKRKNVVIL